MDFGVLPIALFLSGLVALFAWMIRHDCRDSARVIATGIASTATLVAVLSLVGMSMYGLASEKVEYEMYLPIETIGNAQYVQYQCPDTGDPVLYNVNACFERQFDECDRIKVTIFSAGPYNGIYMRPDATVEVPNMDRPPAAPPLYIIEPSPPKNDKQRRRGVKEGFINPCTCDDSPDMLA